MTTGQLIAQLQELDPEGTTPVVVDNKEIYDAELSLHDLADDLLMLIGPDCRRADVVPLYGVGILLEHFARPPQARTSWARVNQAIIRRWSVSGLQWIKQRAWQRAELRAKELAKSHVKA